MKLGERIKSLRLSNGFTMQDLADKAGLSKGYISMLEKGQNPRSKKPIIPSLDTVNNISKAFNLDIDTFLNGVIDQVELPELQQSAIVDKIVETSNQLSKDRQSNVLTYAEQQLEEQNNIINLDKIKEEPAEYTSVNLYGRLSAGTGQTIYDDPIEEVDIPTAIIPNEPYDIMLRIVGDSMQPAFKDGEYVFIKLTKDIRSGQFAAIIVDGEAFLKKVYVDNDELRLVSLNADYKDIIVSKYSNIEVVGTVVL